MGSEAVRGWAAQPGRDVSEGKRDAYGEKEGWTRGGQDKRGLDSVDWRLTTSIFQ